MHPCVSSLVPSSPLRCSPLLPHTAPLRAASCTAPFPLPTARLQLIRDKNVIKPAPGSRKCNCKNKVVTQQLGMGMFQQYTTQVRGAGGAVGALCGEGRV